MADKKRAGAYGAIVRALTSQPWEMLPEALCALREIVALRVQGVVLDETEVAERIEGATWSRHGGGGGARAGATVAVVPIGGVLVPKASMFTDVSGASSVDSIRSDFRAALADREVGAIVLDVDSPGGSIDGITELAGEIRAARGTKPIYASANTLMASAAYHLASQADAVFGSPSSTVGSIGAYTVHNDLSGANEQAGVKTTLISAGKHKTDGNEYETLTDDAHSGIQARVDAAYDLFVADVAAGRGVSEEDVRNGYGEGAVLAARDALSEGLLDGIESLDDTIARAAVAASTPGAVAASIANTGGVIIGNGYTAPNGSYWLPTPQVTVAPDGAVTANEDASFAALAESARVAVANLASRVESLAEFKRGTLTVTKRNQLDAVIDEAARLGAALDATTVGTHDGNGDNAPAITLDDEVALTFAALGLTDEENEGG